MTSLRSSLAKAGKTPPISIRTGLQTCPKRVRELIRILNLPAPDLSKLANEKKIFHCTESQSQGVAYGGGDIWFLSIKEQIFKYRFAGNDPYNPSSAEEIARISDNDIANATGLDRSTYIDHIGDVEYHEGLLFTVIETRGKDHAPILLALSFNLEVVGLLAITGVTR